MIHIKPWMPERVYFEPIALEFPLGAKLYKYFTSTNIPIIKTQSHNRITGIPGKTPTEQYLHAKRTLVVGVKKSLKLDTCRPSADFQFSLGTNCPGRCEYCYLQTTQGKKPYVRVYVNLDEIFATIKAYIQKHDVPITSFEVASTGDPLAIEHLTGALQETIEFFGQLEDARLRVVTKFPFVDSLLQVAHHGHTRFRFSINSEFVYKNFEGGIAPLAERLVAANKIQQDGYPLGFIIAPIMLYPGWQEEYATLLKTVAESLPERESPELSFELIQYRFTAVAKKVIHERFPQTSLNMEEEGRLKKWGKYGKYKYVYPKENAQEIKGYLTELIEQNFPQAQIEYFT